MSIVEPARLAQPGRDVLEAHLHAARPLIATGVTQGWPAERWDFDALRQRCGDALVPVERYDSDESRIGGWITEQMALGDYLARIERGDNLYLSTLLLNQHLPRLAADVAVPDCIAPQRVRDNAGYYIFIGSRQRTEIHFHPAMQAVLVNLYGRKKVGLYGPEETDRLYPYPWYQVLGPERVPAFNWSRVLPDRAEEFPATRRLNGYECVLEPGEMLLIPVHWWHWAESLGPSISVTLLFDRLRGDRFSPRLALRSWFGNLQYAARAGLAMLRPGMGARA